MGEKTVRDALGYVEDLREDVAALETGEPSAFDIVSALGFCRLYGITLPPDIGEKLNTPLPPQLVASAEDALLQSLVTLTEEARTLPERFDGAESIEARSYSTSLLHQLMEAWAAFIVIDDEYQHQLCQRDCKEPVYLSAPMRRLLDAFAGLDNQLQQEEQLKLLSIATELSLLENWRKMLAEPYRDPLPWWLDDTLEVVAKEVRRFVTQAQLVV